MEELTRQDIIARLNVALPQHSIPTETFAYYLRDLADVPIALLDESVTWMIRTAPMERRFPSLREIREACAERLLKLPTEQAALAQIQARVDWSREQAGDPPAVHVLAQEALDQIGGYHAYRTADEPGIVRAQFARIYRELRADAMRQCQFTAALNAGPQLTAA